MKFKQILALVALLGASLQLHAAAAQPVFDFDIATVKNNYHCAVWQTMGTYTGFIPGKTRLEKMDISPTKVYYNVAFYDGTQLVKTLSFPGALLIEKHELNNFKPSAMTFASRDAGKFGYWRFLLTVENGWLFKYNLMAEKNPQTGRLWTSVDFGKRIPLYISDAVKVDPTYEPHSDLNDNVYFKTTDGKFRKWDSRAEKSSVIRFGTPPQRIETPAALANYDQAKNTISLAWGSKMDPQGIAVNLNMQIQEVIDPLAIREDKLRAPYAGYGTQANPISYEDYAYLVNYYQIAIGKVIEAYSVLASGQSLVFAAGAKVNAETFTNTIQQMAQAYANKTNLLRELKLVMREKGVFSILKKWLTTEEVSSIIMALNPLQGGGSVMAFEDTAKDNKRMTMLVDGKPTLSWGYYRMLKENARRGFPRMQWEAYDPADENMLMVAIRNFPKYMMNQAVLASTISAFIKLGEQSDWERWFGQNDQLIYELMFDYLVQLDEGSLADALKLGGMTSMIKQRRFKMVLDMFKRSKFFAGE